jgi:ankyrin repeat domain-containing protein 50
MYCQLDALQRCEQANIRDALNQLPATLDETYARTLQCIPEENWQLAHRLLQCLIAAIRPLRAEELAEVLAIQFDENVASNLVERWRPDDPEEEVLSLCSSLITIVDDRGWRVVLFSHASVKDFLVSSRLAASKDGSISRYYTSLASAHTTLAQVSLTVLLQLDSKTDKKRLETFPLAFYSAQYWVDHAKFENVASQIGDAIKCLFDPNKPHLSAWTWIHDVDSGRHRTIDHLEEHPPPPRATSLYYAALCGFSELVNHLLLTHPEEVNIQCGYLVTPLHAAYHSGQLECVRLLLQHGADVDARNVEGEAVSHLASEHGHVEVVKLLLLHGADVNARGLEDWTPLHNAVWKGHKEVVRLLLEYNPDLNAQNMAGNTPLILAARYGHIEFVRILFGLGADMSIIGEEGWPAFGWALRERHHQISQFLFNRGTYRP